MFSYIRTVQYHESDKMGITHHSNYIKWMEEARVAYLEHIGLPFQKIEEMGIVSPVVGISCEYKTPTVFGDRVSVEVSIVKYNGIQLDVAYTMKNADTGVLVAVAVSRHCFLKDGRIYSPKRDSSPIHALLESAFSHDTAPDA